MMGNNVFSVSAAYLLILISNVTSLETENIIGGHQSKDKEFKYQVSIQNIREHKCGGALIAPDVVLTAAHCFYDEKTNTFNNYPYFVVAGTTNVSDYTYRTRVKTMYLHSKYKNYNNTFVLNDIALIRLDEAFDVGKDQPIDLVSLPAKHENFVGKIANVSGFGWNNVKLIDNQPVGSSSGQLRHESVNIMGLEKCGAEKYPILLCGQMKQTLGSYQGVCYADSGSPLVFENKVIGIVSTGPNSICDESQSPAEYTKVSEFLDFIKSVLDSKPTSNSIVLNNSFVSLYMPFFNSTIITDSATVISIVKKIQKLNQLYYELEEKVSTSQPIDSVSKIKFNEYNVTYEECIAENEGCESIPDVLDELDVMMLKELDNFNALQITETIISD